MEGKRMLDDDGQSLEPDAKVVCLKAEENQQLDVSSINLKTEVKAATLLPAPIVVDAIAEVKSVCEMDVELGMRLEVSWEIVEDNPAEAEESEKEPEDNSIVHAETIDSGAEPDHPVEPEHVWWGCNLASLVGRHPEHGVVWKLVYDAKREFAPEERNVVFCGGFLSWCSFPPRPPSSDPSPLDHREKHAR
jgi:hypothetical protein